MVPWVCLQCVVLVYSDHTHLLFSLAICKIVIRTFRKLLPHYFDIMKFYFIFYYVYSSAICIHFLHLISSSVDICDLIIGTDFFLTLIVEVSLAFLLLTMIRNKY